MLTDLADYWSSKCSCEIEYVDAFPGSYLLHPDADCSIHGEARLEASSGLDSISSIGPSGADTPRNDDHDRDR